MLLLIIMNEDKIQQQRRDQDEQATQRRASILGVSYLDTRRIDQTITLAEGVLEIPIMRQNYIVPLVIGSEGVPWQFGFTTQTPQSYLNQLVGEYHGLGRDIQLYLISQGGYKVLISRLDPVVKVVYDNIEIAKEGDSNTLEEVSRTLNSVGTDDLFNYLIDQAERLEASDIHIENQRTHMRIRMRVDGVLHPVADLDSERYRIILGTLASRANISTASNKPQSGHMHQDIIRDNKTRSLNIRVEVIPTMYGQDAVLRLFNFEEEMLSLDRLGIGETERAEINSIISHPRGMVLVVGPTGSGKSTTLYSMINALNTTQRKIITLEDPIEYSIRGITQVPVDTSNDQRFGDELRSILRLDPDVLMIGEIRDADTARTAIQASVTGHLVLSSFHASSASTAFSRMIDLIGINPIFSTAIRLVVAQRLVRRLDDRSKEEYLPDEATKNWVKEALKDLPAHVEKPDLDNFKLWRPVPSQESPFGFSGRMCIMEQMVVTEEIQRFIRGDEKEVDSNTIERAARRAGMVTLLENGVLTALRGETTLDEVNKVV